MNQNQENFSNSKKKKTHLLWIISGALALVGIGTLAYFIWPQKNDYLTQTNQEVLEELSSLAPDEKAKIDKAGIPEKIRKELSGIIKERILSDIMSWFIADNRGRIMSVDKSSIILHNKSFFLESDYQEIRQAFIEEIKSNPDEWELERRNLKVGSAVGEFTPEFEIKRGFFFKHKTKTRTHDERGMKLTAPEWESILESLYKKLIFQRGFKSTKGDKRSFWQFFHESSSWTFIIEEFHPAFGSLSAKRTIFFNPEERPFQKSDEKEWEIYEKEQKIFLCWLEQVEGRIQPTGNFEQKNRHRYSLGW